MEAFTSQFYLTLRTTLTSARIQVEDACIARVTQSSSLQINSKKMYGSMVVFINAIYSVTLSPRGARIDTCI